VQELGGDARRRRLLRGLQPLVVPMLHAMRPGRESRGGERVQDGEEKDPARDGVERIDRHAVRQRGDDAVLRRRILGEEKGKGLLGVILDGRH
jgi:hypothetical protein